jgi:hypothetical protein
MRAGLSLIWDKMVSNTLLYYKSIMGLFDQAILQLLRDGKPREFKQILS